MVRGGGRGTQKINSSSLGVCLDAMESLILELNEGRGVKKIPFTTGDNPISEGHTYRHATC